MNLCLATGISARRSRCVMITGQRERTGRPRARAELRPASRGPVHQRSRGARARGRRVGVSPDEIRKAVIGRRDHGSHPPWRDQGVAVHVLQILWSAAGCGVHAEALDAWSSRRGRFFPSETRISLVVLAGSLPGGNEAWSAPPKGGGEDPQGSGSAREAREDWKIYVDLAARLGKPPCFRTRTTRNL